MSLRKQHSIRNLLILFVILASFGLGSTVVQAATFSYSGPIIRLRLSRPRARWARPTPALIRLPEFRHKTLGTTPSALT